MPKGLFSEKLRGLKREKLLRLVTDRASASFRQGVGARVVIDGAELINFSSNDYLGLASDPRLKKAAKKAIDGYGTGAGASRLLSGGCPLHGRLEKAIAEFKGVTKAVLFNSGYCLNTGVIPALMEEGDAIFSDELNHASIIDGTRLSRAKTSVYRHKDVSHLRQLIKKAKARRKLIVTDSVFSMDGDIAPLPDIFSLIGEGAMLYIDDAHGTGVLGRGKGSLEHFGMRPGPGVLQIGTLSKAIGSFGAFIGGENETMDWLINTARSFMFSTALPPPAVGASLCAIEIISSGFSPDSGDSGLVERLWKNRQTLVSEIKSLGFDTGGSETPIIPLMTKDVESALGLSRYLRKKGVYAPAIRPPTVKKPRVRLTVSASHTGDDIGALADALGSWRKKNA